QTKSLSKRWLVLGKAQSTLKEARQQRQSISQNYSYGLNEQFQQNHPRPRSAGFIPDPTPADRQEPNRKHSFIHLRDQARPPDCSELGNGEDANPNRDFTRQRVTMHNR